MKNKSLWIIVFICFFIIVLHNFVTSHKGSIMAFCGEYYFKKGNIPLAQEYYEKAFVLGLNDFKQREIYVNSIINSPLTLDAQEKLVKFLENPKDDVAKVKAEYFLDDFKREIHRKFPNNYISNAVFNQKFIRWSNFPVTYTFKNTENIPIYYLKGIEQAFVEWEKATNHQILFEKDDKAPNIIIDFEEHNPADTNDRKYVVAYTTPIIVLDKLQSMEIVFYVKDPLGKKFTLNQVYNTALHEIAHALGFMGHSNDKDNVMYLTKDSITEYEDVREELSEADINTLMLLYKIKPQITNEKESKSEYIPSLVLGSEIEVNTEKIREAKTYISNAPDLPAGYIDLAEGFVQQKDYAKAIKSLKKALILADTDEIRGMIYYNLAVTNYYQDSLLEAQKYLLKSLKYKDSEEKHYLLGEIYAREGNTQGAIREFSDLISKNPKNVEYTVALTNIYVLNRDYFNARRVLKTFYKNNPNERDNPRFKPYGIIKFGL